MPPQPDHNDFSWNDSFLLGYPPMDAVHEEFVELVNAMKAAPDAELASWLDRFVEHAQAHFGAEDGWMNETDFPARECHIGEHAAVMASVNEVRRLLAEGGDCEPARRLVTHLEAWFPGHADYLDSALSHWMCKLRWGGKPVVIRRNLAVTGEAQTPIG
jgi:hemerythrin